MPPLQTRRRRYQGCSGSVSFSGSGELEGLGLSSGGGLVSGSGAGSGWTLVSGSGGGFSVSSDWNSSWGRKWRRDLRSFGGGEGASMSKISSYSETLLSMRVLQKCQTKPSIVGSAAHLWLELESPRESSVLLRKEGRSGYRRLIEMRRGMSSGGGMHQSIREQRG